jgi:hypothetical protein
MRKHKTKLRVNAETIRVLASTDLARAAGGEERIGTGAAACVVAAETHTCTGLDACTSTVTP